MGLTTREVLGSGGVRDLDGRQVVVLGGGSTTGAYTPVITSSRPTIGTTPTVIVQGLDRNVSSVVRNSDASVSVYLGDAAVTTTTGFELKAGEYMNVDVLNGQTLYGVIATGTLVLHLLENRQ